MNAPVRRISDIPGVAEYMHTTVRHIRSLIAHKRIPYFKVGRLVRFDLDEIDAWADRSRIGAQS